MQTIRNPKKNVDFVLLPKADQRALVHAVPSGEDLMTAHGVEMLLLGDCEIPIGHQLMVRPPPSPSLFRYVRSGNKSKPVDDMHTVPVKPGGLHSIQKCRGVRLWPVRRRAVAWPAAGSAVHGLTESAAPRLQS